MSLSRKGSLTNTKLSVPNKSTALNPNAAEFVPFSLRSSTSGSSPSTATAANARFTASGAIGKAVLDRSESSISNTSDEEAHQFWRHQLPDDITPDFKVMSENESWELGGLSLAGLSLNESTEMSKFSASRGGGYMLTEQQEPSLRHINGNSISEKMRYAAPASYGDDLTSSGYLNLGAKSWNNQIVSGDQLLDNGREVHTYNGNSRHVFNNELLGEHGIVDEMDMNPLEFLASQFPGLEAESLSEVYFANGCDLNLTIEMLTQLELQFDSGFNQNMNVKTVSAPNLTALDFPALPVPDSQNPSKYAGDELQQSGNPYQSPEKENILQFKSNSYIPSRAGSADFASAVRKMASQDPGMWKYESRNGSGDSTIGSSRSSHVLASSYSNGTGRSVYTDRVHNRNSSRAAPVWLETGESVANMYSELREEARDHARLRNAYFEQARQAYLIGNKALAKELSVKGQLHNMHMKAAHGKAQDSIYRLRNSGGIEMQGNGRGHERMIDLHGLHVSEALHVLKHELSVLRSTARAAGQRLQVYICVGTGHHTRGSRTPARLPVAVQQYLLEDEGLDYSEPQPGLLRVVIY